MERNFKYRVIYGFICRICKLGINFDKWIFEFCCRICRNCNILWIVDKESECIYRFDVVYGDIIEWVF